MMGNEDDVYLATNAKRHSVAVESQQNRLYQLEGSLQGYLLS